MREGLNGRVPSSSLAPLVGGRRDQQQKHPWRVDLQLQRGGGSGYTRRSTRSWKQRMQERKAVFSSIALPEHDDDTSSNNSTKSSQPGVGGCERDDGTTSNNSSIEKSLDDEDSLDTPTSAKCNDQEGAGVLAGEAHGQTTTSIPDARPNNRYLIDNRRSTRYGPHVVASTAANDNRKSSSEGCHEPFVIKEEDEQDSSSDDEQDVGHHSETQMENKKLQKDGKKHEKKKVSTLPTSPNSESSGSTTEKDEYLLSSFRKSLVVADLKEQLQPLYTTRRHSLEAYGQAEGDAVLSSRKPKDSYFEKTVLPELQHALISFSTSHRNVVESVANETPTMLTSKTQSGAAMQCDDRNHERAGEDTKPSGNQGVDSALTPVKGSCDNKAVNLDQMRQSFMPFGIDLVLSPVKQVDESDDHIKPSSSRRDAVEDKQRVVASTYCKEGGPKKSLQNPDSASKKANGSRCTVGDTEEASSKVTKVSSTIENGTSENSAAFDAKHASSDNYGKEEKKSFQEQLRKSFMAFEAMVEAQQEINEDVDEKSVWTEFTTEDLELMNQAVQQVPTPTVGSTNQADGKKTAPNLQEQMRESFKAFEALVDKKRGGDDVSCWTEYTMEESVVQPKVDARSSRGAAPTAKATGDGQGISVRNRDVVEANRKDDLRGQMEKSFAPFETLLGKAQATEENLAEDEWTEYTLNETVEEQVLEETTEYSFADTIQHDGPASFDNEEGTCGSRTKRSALSQESNDAFFDCYTEDPDGVVRSVNGSAPRDISRLDDETDLTPEDGGVVERVTDGSKLSNYERFMMAIGQSPRSRQKAARTQEPPIQTHKDDPDSDSHEPVRVVHKVVSKPLMKGRMFSDSGLSVAELKETAQLSFEAGSSAAETDSEMEGPIIYTCGPGDDDMTQITFDQSLYHVVTPPASPHEVSDDGSSGNEGASRTSDSSKRIAEILRKDIWSRNKTVVEAALEKLRDEAASGARSRADIARFGGLLAILRAMEVNHSNIQIQIYACNALENMALESENQVSIVEVDGIPSIVGVMTEHLDDVRVQQAACAALKNISRCFSSCAPHSSDDPLEACGAVQALLTSMMRYADDLVVQTSAFTALGNFCVDNEHRLRELSDAGGLATMTTALQQPWENKMEKHEAISTLSILLRSLAEGQQ